MKCDKIELVHDHFKTIKWFDKQNCANISLFHDHLFMVVECENLN